MSEAFEAPVLQGLTEIQREAALWDEGPLILLAGPGSGKTRVLTARIARLLGREPLSKWRVLALTFTTRAADEMRGRIEELAPNSSDRLFIGTFHSFACEILRQSGSHVGVKTDFKIYSDNADRLRLLSEALSESDIELEEPVGKIFPVLDGLRDRLATPDNCMRFFADEDRGHRFSAIYRAYTDHMSRENVLDFPAIIHMGFRLFSEFPVIAEKYRRTYRYTSIDEFQDTNTAQYALIKSFTGDVYKNLFVVADDDQIIYQWNGANPKRLQQFSDTFEPSTLQMPTNFRCPAEVVNMANKLVVNNLMRTPGKQLLLAGKVASERGGAIRLLHFGDDNGEAAGIADCIVNARGQKITGNTAVIARTKAMLQKVQSALSERNITSQIAQRRDAFASIPYQWLHSCLQISNRRSDQTEFADFVDAGNAFWELEVDADALIASALSGNGDLLRSWTNSVIIENFGDNAMAIKIIQSLRTDLAERLDFHKFLRLASSEFANQEVMLTERHPSFEEDARAWKELYREMTATVGRNAPLDTFLQELDLRSKEPPLEEDVIPLLTIHSSKGNEFNHVYVAGLAEDILPSFQSKKQGDRSPQLEEERRNCFVAITRCMSTLTISYADKYSGWVKAPSRFLKEMELR